MHPLLDSSGKIALIHNGNLNNARELREELKALGHVFQGQTDSEVIAKLVGHYYNKGGMSVKEATEKGLKRCNGSWGLCILCSDAPEELVVACNGSPLYIGLGDEQIFIASELKAFNKYTKQYIVMNDGEIGVVEANGRTLDLTRKEESKDDEISEVALPEGFDHWTLKEIMESPEAVGRSLAFGARLSWDKVVLGGLENKADKLSKIQHIALAGTGSSLNAAKYGARLMKNLLSVDGRISTMDVEETDSHDLPNPEDKTTTGLIAVSQSGESIDVKRVVGEAQQQGITAMGVVNVVGSLVARATNLGVYCNAGEENGIASTKTFTSQVTVLALIALWFRELKDRVNGIETHSIEQERLKEALLRLPISLGMALKTREKCSEVARRLKNKQHCFVLGKGEEPSIVSRNILRIHSLYLTFWYFQITGYAEPIAYEGALKMKELSNLHAEGYSGGALKHGPFALIESNETGKFGATPLVMIILDDQHANIMRIAAEEVKARGAELIIITDKPELAEDLDDNPILIPRNGPMTALGAIVPLQLIAYELALLRGQNPDAPRNLAKYYH